MTYANLCAALEPYNYPCKVIGFDTFEGDRGHSKIDELGMVDRQQYNYRATVEEDLSKAISVFDMDRPLNHLKKVELVKGDLCQTAEKYITENPNIIFRIVHLSVNLYEPTKQVVLNFYPRLSKGGAMVIGGLSFTPGATQALFDAFHILGFDHPKISVCDYYPNITYIIKE